MINKDTQKIKRIELPICTTPEARTYSYYALPQCIIMAEERIGKRIAEFEICETDNDTWTSIGMKKKGCIGNMKLRTNITVFVMDVFIDRYQTTKDMYILK